MMKKVKVLFLILTFILSTQVFSAGIYDTDKYAWGENIGWVNFKADNGNVNVKDDNLSGYAWNDNFGWINLKPDNGGVLNNAGNLSGYAWGEGLGWIDFENSYINKDGYFKGYAKLEDNSKIVFEGDNVSVRTYWRFYNCKDHSVRGYAWSENVGWISFDCKTAGSNVDYGVDYDKNGNLYGYAWSENVGWISFNGDDVDRQPRFLKKSKRVIGEALVLSALENNDNSGGWDGIISLNGSTQDKKSYGVKFDPNENQLYDFAWGDKNLGWIKFRGENSSGLPWNDFSSWASNPMAWMNGGSSKANYAVDIDPFYFKFWSDKGQNDNPVQSGGSVTLKWETNGGVECIASDGKDTTWTDNDHKATGDPYPASETIDNLKKTTTFTLECKDSLGNKEKRSLVVRVGKPAPKLTLWVDNDNIPKNSSTTIHWEVENVKNCKASSTSGTWDKNIDSSDGEHTDSTGILDETVNAFKVHCDSKYFEDYPDGIEKVIYVNVAKLKLLFYPKSSRVKYGDRIILYWEPLYANACQGSGDLNDFNGSKDPNSGRHEFISQPVADSGKVFRIKLKCSGSDNQEVEKEVLIRMTNKIIYQEI